MIKKTINLNGVNTQLKLEDGFDEPRAVENYISEIKKKLDGGFKKAVWEAVKRQNDSYDKPVPKAQAAAGKIVIRQ